MTDFPPATVIERYQPPTETQLAAARGLVERWAASWDRPQVEEFRNLMHPDTQNLIPPMMAPGNADAVVEHFRAVLDRLPDLRLHVVRWAPTGDAVIIEWQATATVAGQSLIWTGVDRFNLRDGLMYEGRAYWDTRGLDARMMGAAEKKQPGAK